MKSLLEVDSIEKSYGYKIILSNIYLKCETGNIIGILGRNGTGKSTLLKIIYGILPAEHKFVRIDNKMRFKAYQHKNEISYLPQDNFLPRNFKVSKAINLFIDKKSIVYFCDDTFIQKIYKQKINQLSSGELRYLEIKLILFCTSKFVLLDEPYNGVSPIMINSINELIIKSSKNKGIILTDHNYENVLKVANQLYLIKDCSTKKLKNKQDLIQLGYLKEGMI